MAMYVRNDKVAAADQPKTWADLAQPKYKGKLVMADPSFSSLLVTIVGTLAKEHGWQYFEKLRANDIMLVQGNQQVSDMVKRGERVIAVGADAAYVGESQEGRHAALDALPGRRHVHHSLAELGGEGLAQSECRQGVRANSC